MATLDNDSVSSGGRAARAGDGEPLDLIGPCMLKISGAYSFNPPERLGDDIVLFLPQGSTVAYYHGEHEPEVITVEDSSIEESFDGAKGTDAEVITVEDSSIEESFDGAKGTDGNWSVAELAAAIKKSEEEALDEDSDVEASIVEKKASQKIAVKPKASSSKTAASKTPAAKAATKKAAAKTAETKTAATKKKSLKEVVDGAEVGSKGAAIMAFVEERGKEIEKLTRAGSTRQSSRRRAPSSKAKSQSK